MQRSLSIFSLSLLCLNAFGMQRLTMDPNATREKQDAYELTGAAAGLQHGLSCSAGTVFALGAYGPVSLSVGACYTFLSTCVGWQVGKKLAKLKDVEGPISMLGGFCCGANSGCITGGIVYVMSGSNSPVATIIPLCAACTVGGCACGTKIGQLLNKAKSYNKPPQKLKMSVDGSRQSKESQKKKGKRR